LDKGDLLVTHPIYRQPMKIKFPRPALSNTDDLSAPGETGVAELGST
jgi:hypothetical protein